MDRAVNSVGEQRRVHFFRVLTSCEQQAGRLRNVTSRLLGEQRELQSPWVTDCLQDPNMEDRLESFGAKFSRLQDMICDKLIPAFLHINLNSG